jgi:hypothetical protein
LLILTTTDSLNGRMLSRVGLDSCVVRAKLTSCRDNFPVWDGVYLEH